MGIWALDRPLTYEVPEKLREAVRPGMIVRVPLRGRRVRGWVLSTSATEGEETGGKLQPVAAVSGPAPVFDDALLATARAMARRYVHPLSAFLHLVTPPQMGRGMSRGTALLRPGEATPPTRSGSRTLRRLGPREDPAAVYAERISEALAGGLGAIVVVPEVREGSLVLERLQQAFAGKVAVVHSSQGLPERSKALWSVAKGDRRVVLGGRAAVLAPAFPLGVVIVHAEADRTLKEQRSPYYDARDVAEARAAAYGADLLVAAEGPTLRTLQRAGGWTIDEPSRGAMRATWPLVELIEPTRNAMPRRAVAAILAARKSRSRVLVLVPRLQASPSGPGPAEVAAYLRRAAPEARVARADPAGLQASGGSLEAALEAEIIVATEGALAEVERPAVGTAVALGVDAMIHRPTGRAAEEAFATLWELACLLARAGSPGRLLLETNTPGHHAVQAVVRGDYHFFARHELEARRESEAPPFMSLIRIRSSGSAMGQDVLAGLAALPGTELLGPVEGRLGPEVLLKARNLEEVLDPLRTVVSSAGERLLVEMDPREW